MLMNRIESLIQELCPDGVKVVKIWEVSTWDKKFQEVEAYKQKSVIKYKYLLAKDLKDLEDLNGEVRLLSTGKFDSFTSEDLAGDYLAEGEIVSIPWGGNAFVKYHNGKFVTADNRIATSSDTKVLLNKFLYYFMLNNSDLINSFYRGSSNKAP
jgi:type I restriction enzyme, S subunit